MAAIQVSSAPGYRVYIKEVPAGTILHIGGPRELGVVLTADEAVRIAELLRGF